MTSNHDRLGGFEERLLVELKTIVAQRSADRPAQESAPARAFWRRSRLISVASAGALAIGAAVSVPLLGGGDSGSAAYAITSSDDGTVTVTIYEFRDADGLKQQLAGYGVPADVTYTPIGEHCQADRYELSPTQHQVDVDHGTAAGVPLNVNDVELSFTLRPADFQPDETLVIVNSLAADEIGSEPGAAQLRHDANVATAIGPVEPCELEAD
jgi:hypothetical protein